ncbi:MAG: hypothetical protein AABX45_02455, partial [Nanoarchaeota archaeon]
MKYSELIKVYLELEKTTKKLEKADIIANFLKHVSKDEIKYVIHLLEGRIFPEYDERKIGMSSRLIIKVISASTGNSMYDVERLWKETGALGKVAEQLMKKRKQLTLARSELTIKKVIENIRKLAEIQGQGTVDKKINLITELLNSSNPEEARFIVATILEELRVGVASGIIRDALAKSFDADVEEIEKAYNLTTNYGELAELLKEHGIELDENASKTEILAALDESFGNIAEETADTYIQQIKKSTTKELKSKKNILRQSGLPQAIEEKITNSLITKSYDSSIPKNAMFRFGKARGITIKGDMSHDQAWAK